MTFIPSTISDLASLVVFPSPTTSVSRKSALPRTQIRPFARAATFHSKRNVVRHAPIATVTSNALVKSASAAQYDSVPPALPAPKIGEIKLYLANNAISRLPVDLFWLYSLTVLSMRVYMFYSV